MRIPQQVSERVKEAPAHALRAVFSGIGLVLLVADRIKTRATEPSRSQPAAAPPPAQAQPAAAPAPDETRWRSLDETGNVRLLSEEDVLKAEPPAAQSAPAQSTAPAPAVSAPATPKTEPAAPKTEPAAKATTPKTEPAAPKTGAAAKAKAATPKAGPAAAKTAAPGAEPGGPVGEAGALPVPNYDELTLASLRARLRGLDATQLRVMIGYERANAGREAVLTMFERRVAKLESGEA